MQNTRKNAAFFYKERKRMQRMLHYFIKNAKNAALFYKESKRTLERCILFKRTHAQPWIYCTLDLNPYPSDLK